MSKSSLNYVVSKKSALGSPSLFIYPVCGSCQKFKTCKKNETPRPEELLVAANCEDFEIGLRTIRYNVSYILHTSGLMSKAKLKRLSDSDLISTLKALHSIMSEMVTQSGDYLEFIERHPEFLNKDQK